jgi:NAD(P)-dependent dehydrogenase (short-subunit alcohol dehydrogenase family)
MVNEAMEKFGKIDILVNNAGASTPPKPFMEKTEADWDRDININLRGVLVCTKAVLGNMISRKVEKLSIFRQMELKQREAGVAVYCAAKAGIVAFTKSLAAEMAPGNQCDCVARHGHDGLHSRLPRT